MTYHVRLTHFEGPLDLLLHLIRRDKIDIYDIPISHITREYLSFIEVMRDLRLEVAGEFFVMAATLMRIKAQMLLPRGLDEELDEDPRDELVRNLVEYRKYKEAAGVLAEHERDRRLVFTRPPVCRSSERETALPMEVSVFDLMDAFRRVMDDLKRQVSYRVVRETVTVEEKIEMLKERMSSESQLLFTELFAGDETRQEVIVTFIAILEMIRLGEITALQIKAGSEIWLRRKVAAVASGAETQHYDFNARQ